MNFSRPTVAALLWGAALTPLQADFTYQETTRITGGSMVSMMKFAGAFSKSARQVTEPTQSTVAVKGNQMVHKSKLTTTITDLDKETITTIDNEKKTYTVLTFAQMKEQMDEVTQRLQQRRGGAPAGQPPTQQGPPPDVQFDVKVDDTGNKKSINGQEAHEVIMTMTMQAADAQSGAKGGIDMVTDMWLVPRIAGYEEIAEFYKRMSEKMAWSLDMNPMMAGRPDMASAMSRMQKESAKMSGIPVLRITKMNGKMDGMPASNGPDSQQQQSQQAQNSPPPTSISGALGGMLAGRMKKKQADDAAANGQGTNSANGSLMEMTMEVTTMQAGPADPSLFAVPANYKLVERKSSGR